jgi:subtilisin family serine protease
VVTTILAGCVLASPTTYAASPAAGSTHTSVHPGRSHTHRTYLVTMRSSADLDHLRAVPRRARTRVVEQTLRQVAHDSQRPLAHRLRHWSRVGRVSSYHRLWVVNAVSVTAGPRLIARIAARRDVAAVEPDRIDLVPAASTPADHLAVVRAPEVWSAGDDGSGVVVATLDSGADVTHPDLESRWRGGTDSWYDPYGQHPDAPVDLDGHGTATLGAIVGGDASGTSVGVAPGARWIAARVFDDRGAATTTAVHLAFQWLLDPDHDPSTADAPQVVNGSWSIGTGPSCDLTFQPDVQALTRAGILPVFAAGNFGPTTGSGVSPANYPESLAVGALADPTHVRSDSSRGPSTCGGRPGTFPDVVAPGQDVLTTDRYGLYQVASGTSMAAPQAAGALALLLSARPGLSVDDQRRLVTSTAVDIGATGPDADTGYGRLDARAAYDLAVAPAPDFGLVAPPGLTVAAGATSTYLVTVTPTDGFTGDVGLSVTGPSFITGTAAPSSVTGGSGTSTISLAVAPDAVPGSYPVTVRGTSGALAHEVVTTVTVTAAEPRTVLELSTLDNAWVPGPAGPTDDADVLSWDGTAFRRTVDASASPYGLPATADVDGFARLDASRFWVSFADDVFVPGVGRTQDEDVLLWDGARWRTWFDGTSHGLTSAALDLDEIDVAGGTLYFSTAGSADPPGVRGSGDDADVYSWDGHRFARVWDATAHGLPSGVDVDGLDVAGRDRIALSFSNAVVTVPGLGPVQDEDVVRWEAGTWRLVFDGTAAGLTRAAMDVDAFDLP